MIDFCILGSGVAGSTIAKFLSKKYEILIVDKARGPGGRASNKRLSKNLSFDHGVQYITPKTNEFKKFVNYLHKKKILKIWDGYHIDFKFEKRKLDKKFIGRFGNNAISKYNLKNINQEYESQIVSIFYNNFFWEIKLSNQKIIKARSIILTCPYPQLIKLAKKYLDRKLLNLKINMVPNITTMIAINKNIKSPISSMRFNDEVLAWAANENSKKRFKSTKSLWTLQSTSKWAKRKIKLYKKDSKIEKTLISKFNEFTGLAEAKINFKKTHGWKYSHNQSASKFKSYWDKKRRMGICGDWLVGPKVESAWLSAFDLFKKIK